MSTNGPEPRCFVCEQPASRVMLTWHGADLYLCDMDEAKADELLLGSPPAGAPYHSELIEDATQQTKLDCERDAAMEYDKEEPL